jgi:hypothetical protein
MKFFQNTTLHDILPFIKWGLILYGIWWLWGKISAFLAPKTDPNHLKDVAILQAKGISKDLSEVIASNIESNNTRASIISNLPIIGTWLSSYLYSNAAVQYTNEVNNAISPLSPEANTNQPDILQTF